jgi:ArsR family transcriptional regulator, arsenate/arsenite/antimonite-responsive transcriptional repressor
MNSESGAFACCTGITIDPGHAAAANGVVTLFKALGDPTRYEIFRLISSQPQEICVCDITSRFNVSQPTISHHLKILREVGLITVARRGVWAYYAVDPRGVEHLQSAVGTMAPVELAGAR